MKILLYGGTFDPPHLGHAHNLLAAADCARPDRILIMPAGVPPHKAASHTPAALRLEMCRAAFLPLADRLAPAALEISDWEIGQARRGVTNYTSTTLEMLGMACPGAALYLAMGSDMLLTFDQWHAWPDILQMAVLVVVSREKDDRAALQAKAEELTQSGGRVLFADAPALPMASSGLRAGLAAGQDCRGALAPAVWEIIALEGLYRNGGV